MFEEFFTGLGMEGGLEHRGHRMAWKYTATLMNKVWISYVKENPVCEHLSYIQNITIGAPTDPIMSSFLLTVVWVQEAEQSVQQVSDDGPQLLCGGVVDQLLGLRSISCGERLAAGAQWHTQPLNSVVSQVELQLQLDAVLVGWENTLVLLHYLVWFS